MAMTRKIPILKITERFHESCEDLVVVERVIHVFIEKQHAFSATISDLMIDLFLIGHLFSEGYIQKVSDIREILSQGDRYDIFLCQGYAPAQIALARVEKLITSACGNVPNSEPQKAERAEEKKRFEIETLLSLMKEFQSGAKVFQETGGVHNCGLSDGKRLLFTAEDIGRHNAADKIIGYLLQEGLDANGKILFTTGRISMDIVLKALAAGFSGIISKSAPTDLAVRIARRNHLVLIGFTRGNRCNLYAGENRVDL